MERDKIIESFIGYWNSEFPNYELKVAHLKEPHALMRALIHVFDRLGIDQNILSESPEDNINESVPYYRDLLPVINMTRVVNHILSVMPQVPTVTVSHFLQPVFLTSHSILVLLLNLMVFNEDKLKFIAPFEQELFDKTEQVTKLADQKHKLLELLNEQAEEKGKRAERLRMLDEETKQLEEELKQQRDICDQEKIELDSVMKESRQFDLLLEQKKSQRDALLAEVARKKTLRVYDADDVKAQVEQATRGVQEAEEKYNSLRATLMQKEDSLRNLHTIKPSLEAANNLLHEIAKQSDSLMDAECGDLDSESREGELDVLHTELQELQAARRDLHAERAHAAATAAAARARRQQDRDMLQSTLREALEKDRKNSERCHQAAQRSEQIKQATHKYEVEKSQGLEEIELISKKFQEELATTENMLITQMVKLQEFIKEKQQSL